MTFLVRFWPRKNEHTEFDKTQILIKLKIQMKNLIVVPAPRPPQN